MKHTHASLFSGIGGAELAASWMGWTNVFHCEIQEFQRKVLEYWFPNSISYEDITKTDFTEWRGRIDVLTGGFPCQPFSVAGKRKGAEEGNIYYYVNNEMYVSSARSPKVGECLYDYEGRSFLSYNYFRSIEQAAEAAKRMKETLKKYHEEIGE